MPNARFELSLLFVPDATGEIRICWPVGVRA